MKLSLSWILSHLSQDSKTIDPHTISRVLSEKTTEIESFVPFALDCSEYELVSIISIDEKNVTCVSKEKDEYQLPLRTDGLIGQSYLIKKTPSISWVTVADLGAAKDGILPAIIPGSFAKGVYHDFILTIDNKAITHRPDLWGHRGFAREVAALFDLTLTPIDTLTVSAIVTQSVTNKAQTHDEFRVEKQTDACSKIAFCSLTCEPIACDFNQARFLASVDIRPINFIVDTTNYVMAELGHPMHAFDQEAFPEKTMIVRMAKAKEGLTLLDGTLATLSDQDIIIANNQKPVSLAGILGGKASGIQATTKKIVIEAAHFDGSVIRKTSQRLKKRTDASTRFEKELDPENTVIALKRFLYLIKSHYKNLPNSFNIHVIGKKQAQPIISIEHATIESMIGITLTPQEIVHILTKLEYQTEVKHHTYKITVPSFRAMQENISAADIIEEIARNYGYNAIAPQTVSIPSNARINKQAIIINTVKKFSAFGLSLHELNSYAFLDETFIEKISYQPKQVLTIENPVSENWKTLNLSLMPHLLKAIHDNSFDHTDASFFEIAPIWVFQNEQWSEQLTYTALWYDQTGKQDFYDGKASVTALFNLYGIAVTWEQMSPAQDNFWFEPYQSASLLYKGKTIGYAGMINARIRPHISKYSQSTLFGVELSFDWYLQSSEKLVYHAVSCYQKVHRDLSIFIDNTIAFDTLQNEIHPLSNLIEKIEIIEFLEKDEWVNQRAITTRITFVDHTKTLTKDTIDEVMNSIKAKVLSYGATIR